MLLLRYLVFTAGLALVIATLSTSIQTLVLPRSANVLLTRAIFRSVNLVFQLRARRARTFQERDRVMALYAPLALLTMPVIWLILVLIGYMGMFWAVGVTPLAETFRMSGSSLLTLGFASPQGTIQTALSFSEATIGLGLVALLIAYLPAFYTAFQRRETAVAMLEVRAGSPPSAITMLERAHRLGRLDQLGELWSEWEYWFTEVEESHTSLAALVFFRSPQSDRSWITAAGTILDTASLTAAAVDVPRDVRADLCIRSGYLALRRIADFFRIPHNPDPSPGDPISITRSEFDSACDELAASGVPLKSDRNQAWLDYAGWRVNYDTVLISLAALIMAPYAPWISDRSLRQVPVSPGL